MLGRAGKDTKEPYGADSQRRNRRPVTSYASLVRGPLKRIGKELIMIAKLDRPLAVALLLACCGAALGQHEMPAAIEPAPVIARTDAASSLTAALATMSDEERMCFQHIATLANPFFEGRAPGTRGNVLAAEYVEFYLKNAGLTPLFPETSFAADGTEVLSPRSSFRQTFTYPAGVETRVDKQDVSFIAGGGAARSFKPGTEFVPMGVSGSAAAEGPLVFVGYSIQGGPDGYSTYAEGDDLKGKIVVILRFEPKNVEGKSRWAEQGGAGGSGWSPLAGLAPKLRLAADRGAAGIILVNPPGADDARTNQLDDVRASRRVGAPLEIPVVQMTPEAAGRLLAAGGADLNTLVAQADERGGITPVAGAMVRLDVALRRDQIKTDNVAGVLVGKGALAGEFIVVGAHFDHLGYGYFGSRDPRAAGKLHPGADDNASGTAGLLLAARRMATAYAALPQDASARSVIFIAFCAEESGLNGSRHFVRNSPVQADKIFAMVNMDMIGRLRNNKLEVAGVGTGKGMADWLQSYWSKSGLDVRTLPGGQGPSDHAAFYAAGIPVLHFFTGLSREYHMPTDTFETINAAGATKVAELVSEVATGLATRIEALEFDRPTGPSINMAQSPDPAPGAQAAVGAGVGGVRVRFGISPGSYSDDKPGIEVGEVFPGTSAADAGLMVGDRLVKWDGQLIGDIESWMPLLGKHKPGDEVEIGWVRGTQEMSAKVKLKGRDRDDR